MPSAFGYANYAGAETINVGNSQSRLSFTSSLDAGPSQYDTSVGTLEGTVRVAGREVGEVGVYPTDADPVSTDYVSVDPSQLTDLAGQTVDITVDGRKVGNVEIVGPDGHDPTPQSDGSSLPVPDDAPETDPADAPGMVNDGDGGAQVAPFDGSDPGNWGVDAPTESAAEAAEETYGDGGGSGIIGGAVAIVLALLVGGAALLGGGD